MIQHNLTFGSMLHGAGGHMNAWRHPAGPADASVDLGFVTSPLERSAKNDGDEHPDHALRYEIADEARGRDHGALPGASLRDHPVVPRRANRYATTATA